MKKKTRKTMKKTLAAGVVSLIALGFGFGGASAQAKDCVHGVHQGNCSCVSRLVPSVQHELVPHVVLPESIEYHKTAKHTRSINLNLDRAGDHGMVQPFVASYVAFPSYQIPSPTQMKTVGQSVYPVSPQIKAKALPKPLPNKTEDDELLLDEPIALTDAAKDSMELGHHDKQDLSIQLASGFEEIVPASPLSELDNNVEQTGLFCQKPAKPPAAWSFTSPIFKAASVPMGWGSPGHSGMITQYGPRGCATQIGFQPMGGMGGDPSMMQQGMGGMMPGMGMQNPMMPPMNTFSMGPNAGMNGMNGGVNVQQLPNGMLLLTAPPDHARCGLLRCRCGNQPRMMILPGAPGGMPGMMPQQQQNQGMMPGMMGVGMMQAQQMPMMQNPMMGGMGMQHPMMQNPYMPVGMQNPMMMQHPMAQRPTMQMMPMTAMTPYGMTVVGYQPVPVMPQAMPNPMMSPMMQQAMMQNPYAPVMGMGMMPNEYVQQMQQMQEQFNRQMAQGNGNGTEDSKDGSELKTPQMLGSMAANPYGNMYANPYGMYAQQAKPAAKDGQQSESGEENANAGNDPSCMTGPCGGMGGMMGGGMNPAMMFSQPMMGGGYGMNMNPMAGSMMAQSPYGGMYMTPFGMMSMQNPMQNQMQYPMQNSMYSPMQPMNGNMGMGYGMMNVGMNGMNGMNGMMGGMGGQDMNANVTMSDLITVMMLMNQQNNKPQRRFRLFQRLAERREARRNGQANQTDPFAQLMQAWSTPYYAPDTAMRMPARNMYPYGYFGAQPAGMQTANYGGYYNLYMGNSTYPGLY